MTCERKAIQDSLVLGASIGLGLTALLMLVAGCSPGPSTPANPKDRPTNGVPPSLPQSVVIQAVSSTRIAPLVANIDPPDGFSANSIPAASVPATEPVIKRGSARLGWLRNTNAVGYVIHYGTNSYEYGERATVGDVTNATIIGLDEGRRYYFAINSISTNATFGSLSPEVTGITPIYVSIQQERWSVSAFGLNGFTNEMQQSTNLNDWWTVLRWIGSGVATNYLHTNVAHSWFRVVAR